MKVAIPDEIRDKISYEAWTALSWTLHKGWVQDYKWLFSEKLGRDIGTPETVDRMLVLMNPHALSDLYHVISAMVPFREGVFNKRNILKNIEEAEKEMSNYMGRTSNLLSRGNLIFEDRLRVSDLHHFRNLMIEGYLLGTDFVSDLWVRTNGSEEQTGIIPDQNGLNQLEGEIQRYWAMKNRSTKSLTVPINETILDEYSKANSIPYPTTRKFAERLGL